MTKRLTLAGIMLSALAMPASAGRHGGGGNRPDPSPETITQRSIHRIERVTNRIVQITDRRAGRCAMAITGLLENDNPDRAAEIAERCIGGINRIGERGSGMTARIVERAVNALTELEAPAEMAEAVQNAAQAGSDMIQEHRAPAIQSIEDALAG